MHRHSLMPLRGTDPKRQRGAAQGPPEFAANPKRQLGVTQGPRQFVAWALGAMILAGAPGQSDQVESELVLVRRAYAGIGMARVRFTEERPLEWQFPAEGVIEFAGRGRLSAQVAVPHVGVISVRTDGSRIVSDGPNGDLLDVQPFSVWQLRRILPGGSEIAALFDHDRQLSTAPGGLLHGATLRVHQGVQQRWGEGNPAWWTVLEEVTPTALVRFYVHPESHLIWRTERIDRDTGELVYASTIESFEVAGE